MSDAAVLERLDDIETLLKGMPVPETFGIPFCAIKRGVSDQYLYDHPILQPAFGISEVPGRKLWSLRTIREWLEIPLADIVERWAALPTATKRALTAKRKI